ncbi:MAG: RNA methyltransferase [Patescibacteria group bacterium]|nr:RNA methyltransferase [Patescibacteria group bacterium]
MTPKRKHRFQEVAASRQLDLTVVLENIWDPHNVAAILRSCDAVGIQEINLVYNIDKFPGIGTKAAAGVKKWLTFKRYKSIAACYRALRRRKFSIYASTLQSGSRDLYRLNFKKPTALVFGNEHRGASADAVRLADAAFRIPQVGFAQSLNVSVAAAVSLYEAFRQRRKLNKKISKQNREKLLRNWNRK